MTTIQDFHRAFKAIPNTPLAKTNYDKLALVCGIALFELTKLHFNAAEAFGYAPHDYLSRGCWMKHGLPDLRMLHHHQVQAEAVSHAAGTYIRLAHESEAFTDLLVELHAEFLATSSGDGLGQFFTPPDLCSLTGAIASNNMARHGGLRAIEHYEPCCGTGGLILGLLREVLKACPDVEHPFLRWKVVAADIDPLCCSMTSLQLYANKLLHAQPFELVHVLCENSLTDNLKGDCFFSSAMQVAHGLAA